MKTLCRVCAMILALLLTLSLAACAQDDPAQENQNPVETETTQGEPMVRLYFHTEQISNNSYGKFEYEENWWEKEEFICTAYALDEDGSEISSEQRMNTKGETLAENDAYFSIIRRENGQVVYSRTEYHEDSFGCLSNTSIYQYDRYGRLTAEITEMDYEDPERGGQSTNVYEYVETESGSVGTCGINDRTYVELIYDRNYRLVQRAFYMEGELVYRYTYEYNSAGCQTKTEMTNPNGEVFWSKVIYDYIEVPLSVAEKYPMFKWEYIE